jgi:hypothetical protein
VPARVSYLSKFFRGGRKARRPRLTLSGHSLRCWVEAIRVTTRSLRADSDATWIVAVTVLVAHSTEPLGPGPLDAAAM